MEDLSRRQLLIAAGATTATGAIAAAPDIASAGGRDRRGSRPAADPGHVSIPAGLDDAADRPVRRLDHEGGAGQLPGPEGQPGFGRVSRAQARRLREPHWHPTHWEVDYAVQGKGELGIVTPDDQQNISRLEPGDIGFIPMGWAHYIRNVGNTDLIWVLVFNNPLTDIGLSTMFGGMPTSTFTQTLGVPLASATKPRETRLIV